MSDIALRDAIYSSKISNAELIIINIIEEDAISSSCTSYHLLEKKKKGED